MSARDPAPSAPLSPIAAQIWDMKYRFKSADGAVHDKTVDDSWRRVASALAMAEPDSERAVWTDRFTETLRDYKFLPAGRILAGAGTSRDVTLFNCFVMGTVPDSLEGIFEHLKQAAITMQQGGGIGYDFSTLRPKGALVKGVGADASGPLSFMDVWDAMCRTIMSAGYRRGAMMATMRCDHPDIEAFIEAKRDPGRLRMFNLSVLVSDPFMAAVKADSAWDLVFNGTVFRTLKARDLWDRIMRATYAYAEPGVIFIDRINARNNLNYVESICATNPCVTADTWVMTVQGARQVGELVGASFTALVNGAPHESGPQGFFPTGRKPVLRLETDDGFSLCLTADHLVSTAPTLTRFSRTEAWTPAGALQAGDRIILGDQGENPAWGGFGTQEQGYLIGLLIGDGTLKADKAVLSAWPGEAACNGETGRLGVRAVMAAAEQAARTLPHRADFSGWMRVPGRGESRLVLGTVRGLALDLGLRPGGKTITPAIERCSSAFITGLLRGLFDSDGSVQGSQEKGVSVRLAQSDLAALQAVQRMLQRLGIISRIYESRRPAGIRPLPDGRGGMSDYFSRAQHELIVSGSNLARFAQRVGFHDTDKATRLANALRGYRRTLNRERFIATVKSVTPDGEADVFDVQIPGLNAFEANGIIAHNCGEQPLPPYGACLLGSVNLTRFVRDPFGPEARLDEAALADTVRMAVRMMDNVVDVSNFPLPQQAHEARAKRRIGLGVTGLADALILCGVRYGAPRSLALIEQWMKRIQREAYLASVELAREKGPFPLFDRDGYTASPTIQELDADVREAIATHGIRNALLTSIAPTGTISLFADNVSSGLEPVFSFSYTRKVLMPDGSRAEEEVSDYAYRLYREMFGSDAPLPDYFVSAMTLAPEDHVRVQGIVQKYVDSSISKTINCPEDISFEDFKSVYAQAYELGCKGCTTYRPNDVTGSVLEVKKPAEPAAQADLPLDEPRRNKPADVYEAGGVVYMTRPLDRPEVLPGKTYKVKWPDSGHAMYITLNDVIQDGRRRPFEIFINSKEMSHFAWVAALTRMISAVFRRGGDVSFIVEELKAVFDPRGGAWMNGRYVPSLLAAIGDVIEAHLVDIGFIGKDDDSFVEAARAKVAVGQTGEPGEQRLGASCPKCGAPTLIRQEGCDTCISCGYSKCG